VPWGPAQHASTAPAAGCTPAAATAAAVAALAATAAAVSGSVGGGFMAPVPAHGALSRFTDPWAERQQHQQQLMHAQHQHQHNQQQQQQLQSAVHEHGQPPEPSSAVPSLPAGENCHGSCWSI
jgi:hypothetical protein